MRPVEDVTLHPIGDVVPGSYLFDVLATCASRYRVPVDQVSHILVYRMEDEDEVYEEYEFWDARGVILNNKVYSSARRRS